ncbi:MAG TPA: lipid-A-disaccharide synthase [Magnetospirillaceae bacterium]|jgi:lipid-A-disaccharide synthase
MSAPLIYLVAGEPSGDLLGARLMDGLRDVIGADVQFAGIGGEAMRAAGMPSLFPQADLAVMGLAEVLPRIPRILKRLDETVADIIARKPSAIVTIDSWGYNKRLIDRLKRAGVTAPRIHMVAPMVWAWKEKRVHDLVGRVDLLLCLLPNEPPLFVAAGVRAIHIGHPVLESGADQGDGTGFLARHGIPADATVVSILPGSRRSETSRLLPEFGATLGRLAASHPRLQAVVPTVETVADSVSEAVRDWPVPALVVRGAGERYDAFAASRAALAASGTVTLELALAGVPMVVGYRVNPITAFFARRLVKLDAVSLPNILAGRIVVPELLQGDCRPELLAPALARLLDDGAARFEQRTGLDAALTKLGHGEASPSRRAATAIRDMIGSKI